MYKYMNKFIKTVINDEDELKRMTSADLYDLQYTVETLLKDIYDEEYHRKLLIKYRIESAQKVLEDNECYFTRGHSRGGNQNEQ